MSTVCNFVENFLHRTMKKQLTFDGCDVEARAILSFRLSPVPTAYRRLCSQCQDAQCGVRGHRRAAWVHSPITKRERTNKGVAAAPAEVSSFVTPQSSIFVFYAALWKPGRCPSAQDSFVRALFHVEKGRRCKKQARTSPRSRF